MGIGEAQDPALEILRISKPWNGCRGQRLKRRLRGNDRLEHEPVLAAQLMIDIGDVLVFFVLRGNRDGVIHPGRSLPRRGNYVLTVVQLQVQ